MVGDFVRELGVLNREAMRLVKAILVPALLAQDQEAIAAALLLIEAQLSRQVPDDQVARTSRKRAEALDRRHRILFFAALGNAARVNLLGTDAPGTVLELPGAAPLPSVETVIARRPRLLVRLNAGPGVAVEQMVGRTTNLMRTLRQGVVDGVTAAVIEEGIFAVQDPRELVGRLVEQWEREGVPSQISTARRKKNGVPVKVSLKKHAELVAFNELATLQSEIVQSRQTAAGIEKFRWIWGPGPRGGARLKHLAIDGQIFTWAIGAPVEGDFPGRAINCGCRAEAVVERNGVIVAPGFSLVDVPLEFRTFRGLG